MLDRLIDYVVASRQDRLAGLLVQDIGLCQAWYESCEGVAGFRDLCETLSPQISAWRQVVTAPVDDTEGRRHQYLLRDLISVLQEDRQAELNGDEVAFLCAVHHLTLGVAEPAQFTRLRSLLDPYMTVLQRQRRNFSATGGLAMLAKCIQYVVETDIQRAPSRETRLLAGIEMPCRGPVMTCDGHLRVLGDVPDDCTVVVDGRGVCSVEGYILGRVLAKQRCEVRRNISGVTVVLRGDIRARGIINNAYVVAKAGSVYCRSAQGPKLVFGGKRIVITTGTMLGRYITRTMDVAKEVRGGQIQVSELVHAEHFRHLGPNNLTIVLRRELSCEDFGEVTGAELNRLLSEAYRLRRMAGHFEAMADTARREAEHNARSILMFLFGGSETHKKLEEIVAAQHRLNMVARIMGNLQDVVESAEEGLIRAAPMSHEDSLPEGDLLSIESAGPLDQDLAEENENALRMRRRLSSRQLDRRQTSLILAEAQEKLDRLRLEREDLVVLVAQKEREMQALDQYERLLSGSGKNATNLQVLQKLVPLLREQSSDNPIAVRMQTAFVTVALRNIDQRLRHIKDYEERLAQYRRDFRTVSGRLGKDFQIQVLENPDDEERAARATGRFEAGIKIYRDIWVEDESELPPGNVLTTTEDSGIRTYIRGEGFRTPIKT